MTGMSRSHEANKFFGQRGRFISSFEGLETRFIYIFGNYQPFKLKNFHIEALYCEDYYCSTDDYLQKSKKKEEMKRKRERRIRYNNNNNYTMKQNQKEKNPYHYPTKSRIMRNGKTHREKGGKK